MLSIVRETGWVMGIIGVFTSFGVRSARLDIDIPGCSSVTSASEGGALFSSSGNVTRVRTFISDADERTHVSASESCSDPKSQLVGPDKAMEEAAECLPFLAVFDSGSTLGIVLVSIVHCSIRFRHASNKYFPNDPRRRTNLELLT
jgi:hypothetical protein